VSALEFITKRYTNPRLPLSG